MEYRLHHNNNNNNHHHLRFADDIILFAESEDKLKEMLEELNNEGKKDGMKLNKKKTKIMCNEVARRRPRTGVKIDAEQLEEVTEYKYLGRLITSGNELSKEIGERITSGWRRFGDYSHFLRDKKIPTCLKRKIMDTVILPAMTYGAETWTLTKHLERKLAVAQRSMERSLLNITRRDKIRNNNNNNNNSFPEGAAPEDVLLSVDTVFSVYRKTHLVRFNLP